MTDQIDLAKKYNKAELALEHVLSTTPATDFEVVKIEAVVEYTVFAELDAEETHSLAQERSNIIAEADKKRTWSKPHPWNPACYTIMLGNHAKDYRI